MNLQKEMVCLTCNQTNAQSCAQLSNCCPNLSSFIRLLYTVCQHIPTVCVEIHWLHPQATQNTVD